MTVMDMVENLVIMAQEGRSEELNELRADPSIQLSHWMLACGNVSGNPQALSTDLRKMKTAEDRKNFLVDSLVKLATLSASGEENPLVQPDEPPPEPKKRRRRRSKAQMEADRLAEQEAASTSAAKAAETAAEARNVGVPVPVSAPTVTVDHLVAMLIEQGKLIEKLSSDVTDLRADLVRSYSEVCVKNVDRFDAVYDALSGLHHKANMFRAGVEGFELELIGSQTVGDTPFANACADWKGPEG